MAVLIVRPDDSLKL